MKTQRIGQARTRSRKKIIDRANKREEGGKEKKPENDTRVEIESVWKTKQRERGREEATRAEKKENHREDRGEKRGEEKKQTKTQKGQKGTTTRLG